MNGALATAVDWRKRRREREWDFMWGSLPKASPLKRLFFVNTTRKRTGAFSN
jgi:hypothetical protein